MADEAQKRSNMFSPYLPRERGEGDRGGGGAADDDLSRPPAELRIAPGVADDVEAIARLLAWREGISLAEAAGHARQTLQLPGEQHLYLVARLGAAVVGFGRAALVPRIPAPHEHVPQGWYLIGLVIDPAHRRRGIGSALVRARLQWIAQRACEAFYFANSTNRATIDLHAPFGFREVVRDFTFPRVNFTGLGGTGVLFRADL